MSAAHNHLRRTLLMIAVVLTAKRMLEQLHCSTQQALAPTSDMLVQAALLPTASAEMCSHAALPRL
jgi:hypothetical protein